LDRRLIAGIDAWHRNRIPRPQIRSQETIKRHKMALPRYLMPEAIDAREFISRLILVISPFQITHPISCRCHIKENEIIFIFRAPSDSKWNAKCQQEGGSNPSPFRHFNRERIKGRLGNLWNSARWRRRMGLNSSTESSNRGPVPGHFSRLPC
jgi:hypothetical protein